MHLPENKQNFIIQQNEKQHNNGYCYHHFQHHSPRATSVGSRGSDLLFAARACDSNVSLLKKTKAGRVLDVFEGYWSTKRRHAGKKEEENKSRNLTYFLSFQDIDELHLFLKSRHQLVFLFFQSLIFSQQLVDAFSILFTRVLRLYGKQSYYSQHIYN